MATAVAMSRPGSGVPYERPAIAGLFCASDRGLTQLQTGGQTVTGPMF